MPGVNKAQRIALKLLGSAGEEAEEEARSWFLVCPECGHEISYFEAGGLRLGPPSEGRRMRIRCDRCQARVTHDLVRRPEKTEDVSADPPTG